MGGWSLSEQGGREDRREAEMEKKVTMERGRMNLASSPNDMLFSTLPPRSPHGSWSLIPIPVAVLSLLPP